MRFSVHHDLIHLQTNAQIGEALLAAHVLPAGLARACSFADRAEVNGSALHSHWNTAKPLRNLAFNNLILDIGARALSRYVIGEDKHCPIKGMSPERYPMTHLKGLILALALLAPATASAADAVLTKAVEMTATAVVYTDKCNPPANVMEKLRSVAQLHQTAAGVDADNEQFVAMTMIKVIEYEQLVKKTPGFCKMMTAAFEKGARGN